MAKIILVFGLPGSGKTSLSTALKNEITFGSVSHINADDVRRKYNDWDFSITGRLNQAERMCKLARESTTEYVICDFVCPFSAVRSLFKDCYRIYMNTIKQGRFEDTNLLFEQPAKEEFNAEITTFDMIEEQAKTIAATLQYQLFSFGP